MQLSSTTVGGIRLIELDRGYRGESRAGTEVINTEDEDYLHFGIRRRTRRRNRIENRLGTREKGPKERWTKPEQEMAEEGKKNQAEQQENGNCAESEEGRGQGRWQQRLIGHDE